MINLILLLVSFCSITHAGCTAPSCPGVASCSSTPGCYVSWAQTPTCSFTSQCYGTSQSSCTAANGCVWDPPSGGYCTSNGACEGLTGDACTNAGCEWDPPRTAGGYCYEKDCNYGAAQCTASNGCVWEPNYCGGPDWDTCNAITEEAKCKKEDTGCEWDSGRCHQVYDLNCKNNSEKTGCAADSDTGCWWQAGYCSRVSSSCSQNNDQTSCNNDASKACRWIVDNGDCDSKCYDNSAGTACAASVPSYCQWITDPGECDELNVYCQTKVDGSGCTQSSDPKCSFQGATTESCGAGELSAYCPSEGDSCSAGALSDGCVNSSAFTVCAPLLLAFVAILSVIFL